MVDIPEELARSIQAGDCVLWAGAGIGALAGRPGWEQLMERLIPSCPDVAHPALRELLEQGRLRTILSYVHRHQGDEPLHELLKEVSAEASDESLSDAATTLRRLPWRACFATLYADLVTKVFANKGPEGKAPEVLAHNTVHYLSLREQPDFFVLKTPPTGRAMRADSVLFDLVEEVVRSRTILFLGFEPDDPDFVQILDLVDRVGRGNTHFAVLPYVSEPEAEEWTDRYGIRVVHVPEEHDLGEVVGDIDQACQSVAVRPTDVEGKLSSLDLTRAVRGVALRCDLALDDALTVDASWIEHLLDRVPSAASLSSSTLLRTGSILLAHGRIERARKCFQQVVSAGVEGEMMNVARFNLAMVALAEGDQTAALEGLRSAGEADRSLAIVPPRFELVEVHGMSGTQLLLTCRDRTTSDEVDIEVSTLSRPVGGEEQERFSAAVQKLVGVHHPAVLEAKGGFADGRLFGVTYARSPGFSLESTLEGDEPMSLAKAWELVEPLIAGLEACHARGVLHRNLNPHHVLIGPDGPRLRGFGFPPVVGFSRPSVRHENLGYLAPEVISGAEASPAADAYSLSAIFYRALSGKAPLGSVTSVLTSLPDIDPRLAPLLEGALHPDPDLRLPLSELRKQIGHIVETPELGRAQRAMTEEAEPGQEKVVDLPDVPASLGAGGGLQTATAAAAPAKIVTPEDPNDLEAWTFILERKPMHLEARQALENIEAEARQESRWDRLAEVLQVRVQISQAQQDRARHLRELSELYERKLGAPASAFETLQALLEEVEPAEQGELVGQLSHLAEVSGNWSALADSLGIVAKRVADPQAQAQLLTELGRVYAERLGAPDRALAAYEQAIELEPSSERLQAVVPLYRKAGRPAEVGTSLLGLADLQSGADKHASLLEAARVFREELGDEEGALAAVEVLLAEAPDHPEALALAESLARQLEQWETLVDVLGRRADATLDPEEAAGWRREAARIALDQLGNTQAAIDLLGKVSQADRDDAATARQLAELLRERVAEDPSQRASLIDTLSILVELLDGPEEKAKLLEESAELLEHEVDGRDRALDCRERIVELLPIDRPEAIAAAESLEKVYRRQERYGDLEQLLRRQGETTDADETVRARAWQKLLELHDGPVPDEEKAVQALEALTNLEPTQTKWRDDLLKRYLEREEFEKAGPLIRAQVFDEKDPKRKAELLLRGGILREQIGKMDGAVEALEEAVALDPERVEAWLALRDIYRDNGQPLKAVDALSKAAQYEQNRVEKVRMMFEAAQSYLSELDRESRGLELLEAIIHLDPDHREATRILLEHLIADGQLERAWPAAQTYVMQVRSQAATDHKLNLRALSLAGRCALAVDNKERAREYLEKAKGLDATNLDVLRLLADLDMEGERWQEALRNYQSVVLGVGDKLAPGELSGIYVQMARARVGMKEPPKAMQMLERALEIDADNEDAIALFIELGGDTGGPTALVKGKQRMADLMARREDKADDAEEKAELRKRRTELLQEVAEVQLRELAMPAEGIRTLEKVLELAPDDPAVLHRILDVFTEEKRWRDAVNVLERLSAAQQDDVVRAKYLYAGAVLLRDSVGDAEQARAWMKRVLEADPLHPRAFDAYVESLEKNRAWSDLSKAVRTHLKALPKDTPPARMADLFEKVGDAHERLRDLKTAIAAYDQAARISAKAGVDPDVERARRERVMKLAISSGEDELDKAVHHAHSIIAVTPMEFEVYHRLVEIYLKQGDRERARAVSRTLKFLKQADEAEEELAAVQPGQARSSLQREQWRRQVYHPYEDPRLSDLFSIIWPMVAAREGRTHDHRGVSRKDRVEVSLQSPTGLARYLAHACQVLDVPVPDLFLREKEAGGILVDALAEGSGAKRTMYPSILAGRDALQDHSEPVMKFRAARAIARIRPEHILSAILPSAISLRHAVYGAFRVAQPDFAVPEDARSASEDYAKQIGAYLSAAKLDQLKVIVEPMMQAGEVNAKPWLQGAAYTATRAGFVLCDSIETAAQLLTREGDEGSPISAKDRIADLVAYSVSEPYLKLRKQLGIARG